MLHVEISLPNSVCVVHCPDPWLDDWLAVSLAPLKCLLLCFHLDSVISSLEVFHSFSLFQGEIYVSLLHIFVPYAFEQVS